SGTDHVFLHQRGDLAVVEAELDEDLAGVLAELRRPAADGPAARAVRPDRELRVAALERLALDELRMPRRLAGGDAEIHRDVVRLAKLHPLGGAFPLEDLLEKRGKRVPV